MMKWRSSVISTIILNYLKLYNMREIKFRGRTPSGKWVYGDLHIRTIHPHIHTEPCSKSIIDSDTIGQFTGFKDKNGKEIYEGDIVRKKEIGGYGYEYVGVVRYYEEDCRFAIDITATNEFSTRALFTVGESVINDGYCTIKYTTEYEILGNVYDNPELLTVKISSMDEFTRAYREFNSAWMRAFKETINETVEEVGKAEKIGVSDLSVGHKWIEGYENLYSVTSMGEIYSYRTKKFSKHSTETASISRGNI